MKQILLTVLAICCVHLAFAQYQGYVYVPNKNAQASDALNTAYLNAYHGGMNSFQLQQLDMNNDGKLDLIAFDYVNDLLFPFRNIGTAVAPLYKFAPEYKDSFPKLHFFVLIRDYNCDNIPDLFEYGSTGFRAFRGSYINGRISFKKYKDLYHPGTFGPVNVYSGPSDVPDIFDMDKDGDLDIVAMHSLGTYIQYYRNMRVENNLPCDSLVFTDQAGCYGGVTQGFFRAWGLNVACKNAETSGLAAAYLKDEDYTTMDGDSITPFNQNQKKKLRHGNNVLTVLDIDGDRDFDILCGNSNYNDAQLLIRDSSTNKFLDQDTLWNSTNLLDRIYCPIFPSYNLVDYDGDGAKDLIITPHTERKFNQFAFSNKCLMYKNFGTNLQPLYHNHKDDILFSDMIDEGIFSYPTFYDFDKDGKKDLFIAASTPDSIDLGLMSHIAYYKNMSTPGAINFQLITKDFLNLSAKKYDGLYPHFADIDGDNITDLIMGNNSGQLIYYRNDTTSDLIMPSFKWITDSFQNIKIGDYAAPCTFDANYDGKKDLILGTKKGALRYYENLSNGSYLLKDSNLAKTLVGGENDFGYAAPTATIVDTFNRIQLLIGTGDGTIERYDSMKTNMFGPYVMLDSFYSFVNGINRTVPAFYDIDNDGNNDLIVGHKLGGVKIYRQVLHNGAPQIDTNIIPDAINDITKSYHNYSIYPNPTNSSIEIVPLDGVAQNVELSLYNITGSLVFQKEVRTHTAINLAMDLSNGIYVYRIKNKDKAEVGRLEVRK